jgi:hypothetical protein
MPAAKVAAKERGEARSLRAIVRYHDRRASSHRPPMNNEGCSKAATMIATNVIYDETDAETPYPSIDTISSFGHSN